MRGIYRAGIRCSFPPVLCWGEGHVGIVTVCVRVPMVRVSQSSVGVPLSQNALVLATSASQIA